MRTFEIQMDSLRIRVEASNESDARDIAFKMIKPRQLLGLLPVDLKSVSIRLIKDDEPVGLGSGAA